MDQLLAMRSFARVVEAGSFTRAADSLDMPIATVSKQVQELEAHLGVRLLQRTTRRVTVTPEGEDYYAKSTRILRDLDDIDASFSLARGRPRGSLRIDVGGPEFGGQMVSGRIQVAQPQVVQRGLGKLHIGARSKAVDHALLAACACEQTQQRDQDGLHGSHLFPLENTRVKATACPD